MNKGYRINIFFIVALLLAVTLPVRAYALDSAVTSGTGIQLRDAAVNGNVIKRINSGIRVTIEEEVAGKDGLTWYKVSSNSPRIDGYLRSDFLKSGKSASEIASGSVFETAFDDVKIKSTPGDKGETLCSLSYGTVCTVVDVSYNEDDGYYWLRVSFSPVNNISTGYVRYDYLNTDDFENELKNAGFPDSYVSLLASIHEMYPLWSFKAYNPASGMSFDKCVDAETGISVIQSTGGAALSSLNGPAGGVLSVKGAGGFETSLNGPVKGNVSIMSQGNDEVSIAWTTATRKVVAYYMDPRNFMLTGSGELHTSFFMFLSGTDATGSSEPGVSAILSTTSMKGTIPGEGVSYSSLVYGKSMAKGVNPYLVAARMRQEHGNASGDDLINGKYSGYEGYYNYFNIQANGDNPVLNGLRYAKEKGWNTRVKSITEGLNYLADNYFLSPLHIQDTLYKQRFFFKDGSYYHQYMTSIYAPHNEAKHVYQGYKDTLSSASQGVFLIPVYDSMPDSPASLN